MICGRCDKPILRGEKYETQIFPSASGPGATVHFHAQLCQRTPRQTAPTAPRRPIRRWRR